LHSTILLSVFAKCESLWPAWICCTKGDAGSGTGCFTTSRTRGGEPGRGPITLRNYQTTRRLLVTHFGTNEPVEEIHAGRARDYREWLAKKYATATVAREVKRARQFFEHAKDCKLISDNPFAKG